MNVKLSKLNIALIIIFILIFITLLGILENFIYKLFLILVNQAIAILLVIFINFLLVRYIVKSVIFPGGTLMMDVIMKNEFGKVFAKRFYNKLKDFSQEIHLLKSMYQKRYKSFNLKNIYELLKTVNESINSYLKIYSSISTKKVHSKYINRLSLQLSLLKECIAESQLEDILIENIKDMELSDRFIEFRNENLDENLQKIISSSQKCLEYIDGFLEPKGIKNAFISYFMNDAFGSIFEMKFRLLNEFKCSEQYLMTPDKYKLETLLIYSPDKDCESRSNENETLNNINNPSKQSPLSLLQSKQANNRSKSKSYRNDLSINDIILEDIHVKNSKHLNLTERKNTNNPNSSFLQNEENYDEEILDTEGHCELSGVANQNDSEFSSRSNNMNAKAMNLNAIDNSNVESLYEGKINKFDIELGNNNNNNNNKTYSDSNKNKDFNHKQLNDLDKNNHNNQAKKKKSFLEFKNKNKATENLKGNIIIESNYNSNESLIKDKDIDFNYKANDKDKDLVKDHTLIAPMPASRYLYSDNETNMNLKTQGNLKKKNLIIICCPNGGPFEYSISYVFINYYIKMNFDIFLWNYRGYGLSEGTANYDNIRKDSEIVFNHVKKMNKWSKIGVHGISIGGIPSCYLGGKNLVDFCIADRTFSSMENILKNFKFGAFLSLIYKLFWFYKSDNTENFLKANSPKLALCDPNDNLVVEFSSLKSSLSVKFIKNKLPKGFESILKYCMESKEDYENFIEIMHMCFMNASCVMNKERIRNSIKRHSGRHKNLFKLQTRKVDPKNKNYIAIELDHNIPGYDKKEELNAAVDYKRDSNANQISIVHSISDKNLYNFSNNILSEIAKCLSNLNSAGEYFDNCKNHSKSIKKFKKFLENFFNNLFVWGSYPIRSFNLLDRKHYISLAYESLESVINNLKNLAYFIKMKIERGSIKSQDSDNLPYDLNAYSEKLVNDLLHDFSVIKSKFQKINFSENSNNDVIYDIAPDKLNKVDLERNLNTNISKSNDVYLGNLIPLQCGHNGFYSLDERNLIKEFLSKNNLII